MLVTDERTCATAVSSVLVGFDSLWRVFVINNKYLAQPAQRRNDKNYKNFFTHSLTWVSDFNEGFIGILELRFLMSCMILGITVSIVHSPTL